MDLWNQIVEGKEPVIIAGAMGGFVRWVTLKERLLEGCASIAVGAVCALYLNPLAMPIITGWFGQVSMTDVQKVGFSGFVVGATGTVLAGLLIDAALGFQRRKSE